MNGCPIPYLDEGQLENEDERRRYYNSNEGEKIKDWPLDDKIDITGVFRDTDENDAVLDRELILFSPEGRSESFRVKVEIPSTEYAMVLEVQGLWGRMKEVPVEDFERDWDDVPHDVNPPVIKFEEFFDEAFLESLTPSPQTTGGS